MSVAVLNEIPYEQQTHERQTSLGELSKQREGRAPQVAKRSIYGIPLLVTLFSVGLFTVFLGQLYIDARINQVHYEIEQLRLSRHQQTTRNEQLASMISELSETTRINEIADELGLQFLDNIIYIR